MGGTCCNSPWELYKQFILFVYFNMVLVTIILSITASQHIKLINLCPLSIRVLHSESDLTGLQIQIIVIVELF